MDNRPTGRKKNITGQGNDIRKQGQGLGTGPVGNQNGYFNRRRRSQSQQTPIGQNVPGYGAAGQGEYETTRSGGKGGIIAIIIAVVVLLVGGGGSGLLSSLFGGTSIPSFSGDAGWSLPSENVAVTESADNSNNGTAPIETVADGTRAKRTKILGNGNDTVTIMVYMCGTDLESKSGMASSDLEEMTKAKISDKVNVVVYTGGCRSWKNDVVSSSVNQIYEVKSGGVRCVVKDDGRDAMTKPETLSRFIKYAAKNYPANRNMLIFWDHGAGSISGYGYDEKNASAGSMSLSGINKALTNAGTKFDVIGFDACLMATYENAMMLEQHADYLIASEETEPGIGWYYTNWLTHLSSNTSVSTVDLGKEIADDFVKTCNSKCPGQKATLSVVDLAELANTTPSTFKSFADEVVSLCKSDDYQKVSKARAGSRSFAVSSKKDMVDLAHLGYKIGTESSIAMADSIVDAVKYNRASSNMANSYGLSIYFPYQTASGVNSAAREYAAIGMDDSYTNAIRSFASLEITGQAVSEESSSPLGSLLGSFLGQSPVSSDGVSGIFDSLLSGGISSGSGLSGLGSLFGRDIDKEATVGYIAENQFDSSLLKWNKNDKGVNVIHMEDEQWYMVNDLELNVFYDDGEGYIDLGLDNVYDFTDDGDLIGEFDGTWLAIDNQPVPYYFESQTGEGNDLCITGYVPVLINGERAELIISFDSSDPDGYIAGSRRVYVDGETETVAKAEAELNTGDKIQFVCDYYSYDGEYQDSYLLDASFTYTGNHTISNVYLPNPENAKATYVFIDIYNQEHWTEVIPNASK